MHVPRLDNLLSALHLFSPRATNPTQYDGTALQPWVITNLGTFSPSGEPNHSPNETLHFTITDPNTVAAGSTPTGEAVFPPSTANCSASWPADNSSSAWGVRWDCTPVEYGTWSFVIRKPKGAELNDAVEQPYPTEDFDLHVRLVDSVRLPGATANKTWVGKEQFAVGLNMAGECGGSGVCYWWTKEDEVPMNQTLKKCSDTCP